MTPCIQNAAECVSRAAAYDVDVFWPLILAGYILGAVLTSMYVAGAKDGEVLPRYHGQDRVSGEAHLVAAVIYTVLWPVPFLYGLRHVPFALYGFARAVCVGVADLWSMRPRRAKKIKVPTARVVSK